MKFIVVLSVVLALGASVPHNLVTINENDFSVSQDFDHSDDRITELYSWRSPEGQDLYVRPIANSSGYRVVDSNGFPTTVMSARTVSSKGGPGRQTARSSGESDEVNSKEDSIEDRYSIEDNSSSPEDKKRGRHESKFSWRRPSKRDNGEKMVTQNFRNAGDDDDLFNEIFTVFV